MTVDFKQLCQFYQFGELVSEPVLMHGGRSHETWRIESSQGMYVVKQLLAKFSDHVPLEMYRNTEAIAMLVRKSGLPAIAAILHSGKDVVYNQNNKFLMVYPFANAQPHKRELVTPERCRIMGSFLAKLHSLNLEVPCGSIWSFNYDETEWTAYLDCAIKESVSIAPLLTELFDDITYCHAHTALDKQTDIIVSHRDLDAYNVLWKPDDRYAIIDWESAGKIDAAIELMFVAIAWSMQSHNNIDMEKFAAVLEGYRQHRALKIMAVDHILYSVLTNWLSWARKQLKNLTKGHLNLADQTTAINEIRGSLLSFQYVMANKNDILKAFV